VQGRRLVSTDELIDAQWAVRAAAQAGEGAEIVDRERVRLSSDIRHGGKPVPGQTDRSTILKDAASSIGSRGSQA